MSNEIITEQRLKLKVERWQRKMEDPVASGAVQELDNIDLSQDRLIEISDQMTDLMIIY